MYFTTTRPDIMFAVSMLSRFMHCASEMHLQVVKQIVRYVKRTVDYGVKYTHSQNFFLDASNLDNARHRHKKNFVKKIFCFYYLHNFHY